MKNQKTINLVIICATILVASFFITKTNFYIKDASNNQLPNNLVSNTISVAWDGKVFATPDMLILNISVEEIKETTEQAQTEANKKINQIKNIIKEYDIKDSNIQTKNVNVYPEYDYKDEWRKLLWYRARHWLEIKIKNANLENNWVWWKLIDAISKIWWVVVNNIWYDIEDKTPYYTKARELAIQKAKQKAEELANIAWVKLTKPISISENMNTHYPTPMYKNTYAADMWMWWIEESAEISLWELEINLDINVIYGIE